MENNIPKIPEHLESLLSQLKNCPVLVIKPKKKNTVDIVQIIKMIPNQISKIILSGIDKKDAEQLVNIHNENQIKKL